MGRKKNNHNPHASLGTPRAGVTVPLSPVSPPLHHDEEGSWQLCREIPTLGVRPSPGICPPKGRTGLNPRSPCGANGTRRGELQPPPAPQFHLPAKTWGISRAGEEWGKTKVPPKLLWGGGRSLGARLWPCRRLRGIPQILQP